MKTMRKITAIVLALIMVVSCFAVFANAAPTIKSMKIIKMPNKTTFVQGTDWDYGYWDFPDNGDGMGTFVKKDGYVTFMHRGGYYSHYSDRGMLDMNGLVVEVTYSDGSKKEIKYEEEVVGTSVSQNILVSPKGGYKVGENTVEVYFKENVNVYTTYQINILTSLLKGDVDFNGDVNSSDALLVLQHVVEIKTLTGDALAAADVQADGKINSGDALAILKIAVG